MQGIGIANLRRGAVEAGVVAERTVAAKGSRGNVHGDHRSRIRFRCQFDAHRQFDEAVDIEANAVIVGGGAVNHFLVLCIHGGNCVAARQGQVLVGEVAVDDDRGRVAPIGIGDLSRSVDQAGVVLVEDPEEEVVGAGGNMDRVRCWAGRWERLASHHSGIKVARTLIVEARIQRPFGRFAKGDLAGDRVGARGCAD